MQEVQTKYQYWRLVKRNLLVCCFKQKKQVFKRTFSFKTNTPLTEAGNERINLYRPITADNNSLCPSRFKVDLSRFFPRRMKSTFLQVVDWCWDSNVSTAWEVSRSSGLVLTCGRKFRVVYGDLRHLVINCLHIPCSVPQGSVLGPRLFILNIADLEDHVAEHGVSFHAFADDTQLYVHSRRDDVMSAVRPLENCIDDVSHWMSANRLKLNAKKTELLWAGSRHGPAVLGLSLIHISEPTRPY